MPSSDFDGCMNFFAGPANPEFRAELNFYNVHYAFSPYNRYQRRKHFRHEGSAAMMAEGSINPAGMVTHIGGLDAVIETTKNLPHILGGKKLIYTNISLPLTAIDDFERLGTTIRSSPILTGS